MQRSYNNHTFKVKKTHTHTKWAAKDGTMRKGREGDGEQKPKLKTESRAEEGAALENSVFVWLPQWKSPPLLFWKDPGAFLPPPHSPVLQLLSLIGLSRASLWIQGPVWLFQSTEHAHDLFYHDWAEGPWARKPNTGFCSLMGSMELSDTIRTASHPH